MIAFRLLSLRTSVRNAIFIKVGLLTEKQTEEKTRAGKGKNGVWKFNPVFVVGIKFLW
jgi:hypothetical protein